MKRTPQRAASGAVFRGFQKSGLALAGLSKDSIFAQTTSTPASRLLPNYFHERPLASASIKFAVKDLFPRPKIEFAFCNSHDDFATHDLPFQMGVGVIFASPVVMVL